MKNREALVWAAIDAARIHDSLVQIFNESGDDVREYIDIDRARADKHEAVKMAAAEGLDL